MFTGKTKSGWRVKEQLLFLLVCTTLAQNLVEANPLRKITPNSVVHVTGKSHDLPHTSTDLKPSSSSSATKAGVSQNEITLRPHVVQAGNADADNPVGLDGVKRLKRSPYPPGFVAWKWTEPCFCPPGQFYSCRCNSANKNSVMGSSSEEKKIARKRRSRSRKSKVKA